MRALRGILLVFLALFPLVTLFHRNDLGRWDLQRSAMAAPDEFSYLLMAQHFLQGGGLSLQDQVGRDTFYPPGFPLLIAGWTKLLFSGQLTPFAVHALNALLLCVDTLLAYFLSRQLLVRFSHSCHRRFFYSHETANWLALLIAAIFATNWHVLETALFVMSEPFFMFITFAWLALGLRWRDWPVNSPRTLAMAALAVLAWSIRGAGIVCVAVTAGYPIFLWIRQRQSRRDSMTRGSSTYACLAPMLLALLIPLAYQIVLTRLSPEKSVTSGEESANSYPRQLLHGLTAKSQKPGDRLHFSSLHDYPAIVSNLVLFALGHFNDYAASFVPWPRENPDFHFRDLIGKIFGFFGLTGWLFHLSRAAKEPAVDAFPAIYVLLYMGLYLVWPFNFARFWSPILPLTLAYAADALIRFPWSKWSDWPKSKIIKSPRAFLAALLLGLLLSLAAAEDYVQLGNYARRLNYVSDSLADAVRVMKRAAPDPAHAIIATLGGDDQFAMAWYFSQGAGQQLQYTIHAPRPHIQDPTAPGGDRPEKSDEMLLRLCHESQQFPGTHLLFFKYFPNSDSDTRDTLESFQKQMNGRASLVKIFQKEIIATVWEIRGAQPPALISDLSWEMARKP
jgi:hypothetical protein